jgi:hypothetical protein
MAMTGGIGYEIDQLTKLGVPELMRRQSVDPQLKYALALQEATKMVEAAARERDMAQQMPMPADVVGQMETSLAKRLAPGVQQQGQRSMQMQNRAAMGLPGQAAPNLARMANGGIVGYQDGGDVMGPPEPNLYQRMGQGLKNYGANAQESMGILKAVKAGIGVPYEERSAVMKQVRDEIAAQNQNRDPNFIERMGQKLMNAGLNVEESKAILKKFYNTFGKTYEEMSNGMAMGGIVGYKKGGGIDIDALLDSLMMAESGGNPRAVSNAGAEGAYQIMPATAAQPGFGVSPMEGSRFDPEASRKFAKQYLQAMLDRYNGDVEAALVAYNAGPGNADKFVAAGKDYDVLPMAMQTKPYVSKIMGQVEREDRRRDFQMGGGRTISTTAPESYTERQRRETKERADRALASRFATVPEETKSELYEPNIEDAASVADAMSDLLGGQWDGTPMNMGERDPRFSDPANYLRDMGAKQEDDNRTRFAQAFPRAEQAVADYAEDKKLGGLGALRTVGRLQENRRNAFSQAFPNAAQAAADYAADKEMGGIGALRVAGRLQEQREANEMAEASRVLNYLKQQAQMQQMLEDIDPAADVQGFNEGGGVTGFLRNLIAPERESLEGVDLTEGEIMDVGMSPSDIIEPFKNDPVGAAANLILAAYGSRIILQGAPKVLGPIVTKYGAPALQRAKELAAKAVTTPKMSGPGSAVRGPKGKMMSAEKAREAGVPLNRQFSPGRTAVTGALGAKVADALIGEEPSVAPTDVTVPTEADIFRRDAPAGFVRAIDANEGEQAALRDMFPDAPEMTAEERTAERARIARGGGDRPTRRGAGLAGLLDQAKPYASTAASIAQILGRGAGASKGFEGAKFVEESAKLRAAEQARQDRKEALEAELGVRREQIAATQAAAQAAAAARLNQEQMRQLSDFLTSDAYTDAQLQKAKELGTTISDPRVTQALEPMVRDFINRVRGGVGGMGGLESMSGLPEGVTVTRVN